MGSTRATISCSTSLWERPSPASQGAFFAVYMTVIAPVNFTLGESVLMIVMVIVGGLGSLPGAVVGRRCFSLPQSCSARSISIAFSSSVSSCSSCCSASPGNHGDPGLAKDRGRGRDVGVERSWRSRISPSASGAAALDGISVTIEEGEILGMIGPNGSGKTTFINVLTKIYAPDRVGSSSRRADRSSLHVPDHRKRDRPDLPEPQVFKNLSVLDNVVIGRHHLSAPPPWGIFFRPLHFAREERTARKRAMEILELVGLHQKAAELARTSLTGSKDGSSWPGPGHGAGPPSVG